MKDGGALRPELRAGFRKMIRQVSSEFWKNYYTKVFRNSEGQPVPWLDYSNERVQAQIFSLVLEAAGPLVGRDCLDVGCGWGGFSLCIASLGGEVTGIDLTENMIVELRSLHPEVRWIAGNFLEPGTLGSGESFDLITAIEVLQYVSLEEAVSFLWKHLKPGGRLVGALPNADCPIVQRTICRFHGHYNSIATSELISLLKTFPNLDAWAISGLSFRDDQKIWPYEASPWITNPEWKDRVPNRLLFVAQKAPRKVGSIQSL
jgi:2-polyprenyl-3-methyl-5-hydroxy-6-metoxy-1,4-benzoquinol methylase